MAGAGMYLPIVGAVAQHAPEDVPNFYKQRGTWAIDTVRLMVWCRLKGLNLRQRAQFWEMLAFYLNAFTAFVYIPSVACSLLGSPPLIGTAGRGLRFAPAAARACRRGVAARRSTCHTAIAASASAGSCASSGRRASCGPGWRPSTRRPSSSRSLGGPNRKPTYVVTRKEDDIRWHWRHTMPQTTLVLLVACVMIYGLRFGTLPSLALLAGSVYWGGLNIALLTSFVTRSWHGLKHAKRVAQQVAAPHARSDEEQETPAAPLASSPS